MVIVNKTTRQHFEDIKIGECFVAHTSVNEFETLFLKIEPFYDKECEKTWNAIRLKDGAFWPFHPYDRIRKVKAKIEYEEI